MSYYYNYYIGYIDKGDEKIYPFGPYTSDDKNSLVCVMDYSKSFDYGFSESFHYIPEEMYSEELLNTNDFKDYFSDERCVSPKYRLLSDLPDGDYIERGYFLIEEVAQYLKGEDADNVFTGKLDPLIYNAIASAESQFGSIAKAVDDFGTEYTPHSARDWMYFAYPDYTSVNYRGFLLRKIVYAMSSEFDDREFVIISTEG